MKVKIIVEESQEIPFLRIPDFFIRRNTVSKRKRVKRLNLSSLK